MNLLAETIARYQMLCYRKCHRPWGSFLVFSASDVINGARTGSNIISLISSL